MRNILVQKQMEMELAGARQCPRSVRRQHRANRANWWFNQMRELVDRAFDYEPAPEPRFRTELFPHRLKTTTDEHKSEEADSVQTNTLKHAEVR